MEEPIRILLVVGRSGGGGKGMQVVLQAVRSGVDIGAKLVVPADFTARINAAVARGTAQASAWAERYPSGSAKHFDSSLLHGIPAPPDGADAARDLDLSRAAAATRTDAGNAIAQARASDGGWPLWDAAIREIGRTSGAAQAALASRLVQEATMRAGTVTESAKHVYQRLRPYQVDPNLGTVVPRADHNFSWPSGHATAAFAAALVLAAMLPSQRATLIDAATQVAWSRVYGGVHFTSDVVEGALVGSTVAADVLRRAGVAIPALR